MPEPVGELARAAHGLRRAAAELAVVLWVRPQLERHADGSPPAALTSSAATALSTPPLIATSVRPAARARAPRARGRRAPSARCSASAASSAAWRLAGAQPAELRRDLGGADARGVEQRGAAHERDGGAAGGDRGAAAAGVEAGVSDAAVGAVRVERDREADQIAAGRAAGRAGERVVGRVPAPERVFEMVGQLPRRLRPRERV